MSKHHPSEWWTSTLLAEYGPTDRAEYDVLVALTSWRADKRVVTRAFPELARRARMSTAATKAAVKRLERAGLLSVVRPLVYGRGTATGYVVNREPLVAAACDATGWAPMLDLDELAERGTETYPFDENGDDERGTETTPFIDERGTSIALKGYENDPPVVIGVQGRGVRAVAEAARNAPAAPVEPTAPPLPELDNGKPQPPTPPRQTCTEHDSWKGDHLCRKCMADRLASSNHEDAVTDYRAALARWESTHCAHGIPNGATLHEGISAGGCHECEERHAEAERKRAERVAAEEAAAAELAALPECDHDVPGGGTVDEHSRTAGACFPCERALRRAHIRDGCDEPECTPIADRAYLSGRYSRTATIGATA